jgi:hypothetical protein
MILPAHVADALERFGAPGSDYQTRLQKGARWLQAAWKWDKLYNPVHAPIYWTNNLKSDMVAIARGNPRALTYIPKAAVEIARALRGKMISPELNRWIDKGGLASTFIRREGLGEGAGVDLLRKYYTHQEPRWVRVKQAYKNVMELPHEWREATGRYATYLAFLDDLKTNGGMPKRYGASIPALVDGLSDLHDKAWKLSNDLVGAYNEVSPVGQNLRRFVFPFWSWQEVSFKREMRLLRNAINSPEVARGMGKQLNGVQATGVRLLALSRYLAGAAMVGAAAEGWNRMWYGADYRKKLPKELRESFVPVWILRSDPKSGQLLYHRFPGDFVETLDWLGINGGYHYLQDYMNRKMTGWEIAKDFAGDSARALANHVYQQSSFAFKAEQELIGGQTGFPDATDPRRVDKLEAFFRGGVARQELPDAPGYPAAEAGQGQAVREGDRRPAAAQGGTVARGDGCHPHAAERERRERRGEQLLRREGGRGAVEAAEEWGRRHAGRRSGRESERGLLLPPLHALRGYRQR